MRITAATFRLSFLAIGLLLVRAVSAEEASQISLSLLSKDAAVPIPWEATDQPTTVLLTAKGGKAEKVSLSVISISHEAGIPFPQESLGFKPSADITLPANSVQRINVIPNATMLSRPGKYTVRILLAARNTQPKEESLVLLRPEPVLEAYPSPLQVSLTRLFPLPVAQNPKNAEFQMSLSETSSRAGIGNLSLSAGPLLFAEKGYVVPGSIELALGKVGTPASSIGPGNQLVLFASVRRITRTGDFTSQIRFQSPHLKQPFVIQVKATVTDFWIFPLVAIGVGVLLSYWVSTWTGRRRALILERSLIQLGNEVDARVPAGHADRPALLELLGRARAQLDQGNLDGAKTSLDEAERRFHTIVAPTVTMVNVAGAVRYAMPAVAAVAAAAAPPPAIVCDDPRDAWDTDRSLGFRIINPPAQWGDATTYIWDFHDGTPQRRETGVHGQTCEHRFATSGPYQITLTVDPDPTGMRPLYYPVEIKASRVQGLTRRIARGEMLLALLTVMLASATGLIALYFTGKPFGSVADYIGALLWGFGLDKGAQGLAAVRARVMG